MTTPQSIVRAAFELRYGSERGTEEADALFKFLATTNIELVFKSVVEPMTATEMREKGLLNEVKPEPAGGALCLKCGQPKQIFAHEPEAILRGDGHDYDPGRARPPAFEFGNAYKKGDMVSWYEADFVATCDVDGRSSPDCSLYWKDTKKT